MSKKKEVRARGWVLTLPAEEYSREEVAKGLKNYSFIGQLERGKASKANPDGYLHWQIYFEARNPVAFSTLKRRFPKGHFEKRRGTPLEATVYVTKPKSREGSEAEARIVNEKLGAPDLSSSQGKRTDLETYASMMDDGATVDEVMLTYPDAMRYVSHMREYKNALDKKRASVRRDVKVRYLYGSTGVGKTRYVFEKYGLDAYRVSNYRHPFDTYEGEGVLILDEFRGQMDFSDLLNVLDGYPLQLSARYADKPALYDEVWVISNVELDTLYRDIQWDDLESWKALVRRFDAVQSWEEFVSTEFVDGGRPDWLDEDGFLLVA